MCLVVLFSCSETGHITSDNYVLIRLLVRDRLPGKGGAALLGGLQLVVRTLVKNLREIDIPHPSYLLNLAFRSADRGHVPRFPRLLSPLCLFVHIHYAATTDKLWLYQYLGVLILLDVGVFFGLDYSSSNSLIWRLFERR